MSSALSSARTRTPSPGHRSGRERVRVGAPPAGSTRRPEAQHCADTFVDGIDERSWELTDARPQPGAIDQLQTERDSDRILRKTRDRRGEQHVAGEAGTIDIRREGHDVRLPHLGAENIVG